MKVVGQLKRIDANINACRDGAVCAAFARGYDDSFLQIGQLKLAVKFFFFNLF